MNKITRSVAIDILCRHLNRSIGRVTGLATRLADADLLPRSRGRQIPYLCLRELSRLLLVVLVDDKLGSAAAQTIAYENLRTENGVELGSVLEGIIRGDVAIIGDAAFQTGSEPAAMLQGLYFGATLNPNGATRITHVPAPTMQGIVHELNGKNLH